MHAVSPCPVWSFLAWANQTVHPVVQVLRGGLLAPAMGLGGGGGSLRRHATGDESHEEGRDNDRHRQLHDGTTSLPTRDRSTRRPRITRSRSMPSSSATPGSSAQR